MAAGRRGAPTATAGRIGEPLTEFGGRLTEFALTRLWIAQNRSVPHGTVLELFMSHSLNFPATGFVRLRSVIAPLGPIPVGKSTWWAGVKTGRFPRPVKLGPRTTVWRVEDINELIERLGR